MNTKINTSKTTSVPQPVVEQLHFLSKQQAVEAMFVSTIIGSNHPCIVVLLNNEGNATAWRKQKWVRKALEKYNVTFLIINEEEKASHHKQGTLFMEYHCHSEKAIKLNHPITSHVSCFAKAKKQFKRFTILFYKEIESLRSRIKEAEETESYITVFAVYKSLYNHYCSCFEWLLLGTMYKEEELNSRLRRLCLYCPDIKKLFVKSSETTYFLINALLSGVEADQDDIFNIDLDYLSEIAAKVQAFNEYAESLFQQLKKATKKVQLSLNDKANKNYDYEKVLHIVSRNESVESIYQYNCVTQQGVDNIAKREIRYWLIVGEGISNHQLLNWFDAVKQITKDAIEIVPIAHSRSWIQKRLFENQHFFQQIMQDQFIIYERESFLPKIHWQVPYTFCTPDLHLYRKGCAELHQTIQLLRNTDATAEHEGIGFLYSSLIARSCQIIIYARMGYYPNQLPIAILWRLAELADERTVQLRFLNTKLTVNLINFINHHHNIYQRNQKITPNDLNLLDTLTAELINQLNQQ